MPRSRSKTIARPWRRMTGLLLTLLLLISMTGCSKHFVVIKGGETVVVSKETIDHLYSDNERLLLALKECRGE